MIRTKNQGFGRWAKALSLTLLLGGGALAADHLDPARFGGVAGDATDIGDLYAWHQNNSLYVVLTFAGPVAPAPNQSGTYDRDALYGIHIDNTGDSIANTNIWVRFAQNDLGETGVQVTGLPGTTGPLVGAVETELSENGARAWVGLRDDPFFFDLQGFSDTLATGTLMFDSTRDTFAGQNITAIVLEMPLGAASAGNSNLNLWATTARFGG